MNALQQFLQAASNEAAGAVSGPVDLIGMGLRKLGVPVPRNALMSSEWMKQNGLMQDVPQSGASLAGQTFGLLSPVVAAAKAPQIARGLLQAGQNAQTAPTMSRGLMGGQRGAVNMGAPDWADDFAGVGGKLNPDGTVTVYHRTSPQNAESIRRSGTMRGKEDGLFFSSAADGQITQYGPEVVELRIPASKLMLDDLFDSEAHFRLPTRRSMEPVRVADWLKK